MKNKMMKRLAVMACVAVMTVSGSTMAYAADDSCVCSDERVEADAFGDMMEGKVFVSQRNGMIYMDGKKITFNRPGCECYSKEFNPEDYDFDMEAGILTSNYGLSFEISLKDFAVTKIVDANYPEDAYVPYEILDLHTAMIDFAGNYEADFCCGGDVEVCGGVIKTSSGDYSMDELRTIEINGKLLAFTPNGSLIKCELTDNGGMHLFVSRMCMVNSVGITVWDGHAA